MCTLLILEQYFSTVGVSGRFFSWPKWNCASYKILISISKYRLNIDKTSAFVGYKKEQKLSKLWPKHFWLTVHRLRSTSLEEHTSCICWEKNTSLFCLCRLCTPSLWRRLTRTSPSMESVWLKTLPRWAAWVSSLKASSALRSWHIFSFSLLFSFLLFTWQIE